MHNSNFLNVSLILYKILHHSLAVSRFPSILQGLSSSGTRPSSQLTKRVAQVTLAQQNLFSIHRDLPLNRSQRFIDFHFFSSLHKRVALKRRALKAVHCATFEVPAWNQLG